MVIDFSSFVLIKNDRDYLPKTSIMNNIKVSVKPTGTCTGHVAMRKYLQIRLEVSQDTLRYLEAVLECDKWTYKR